MNAPYELVNSLARQCFQMPTARMPVHKHEMTIGEGRGLVTCCFDVSDEGDIKNMQVLADGRDIFKYLPEKQIIEIEAACWADYVGECKQNNADIAINNYEAGL